MGISDDIKPKIIKESAHKDELVEVVEEPDGQSPEEPENEPNVPEIADNEVPIDKSGATKPVYEDIFNQEEDTYGALNHSLKSDIQVGKSSFHKPETTPDTKPDAIKPKAVKREEHFKAFTDYPSKHHKSHWLTIIVILFVVLLVALLVWQNLSEIKNLIGISEPGTSNETSSKNNGVEVIDSQDYTTSDSDQDAITPEPSTPATVPTANPVVPTTTSNISSLSLVVLNGNGITGTAAKVKDLLTQAGYNVTRLANAAKFTYLTTNIYYKSGQKSQAEAVAKILSSRQTAIYENAAVVGSSDIVVVVGKK